MQKNRNSIDIDKLLFIFRRNWFYIPLILFMALIFATLLVKNVGKNYKIEGLLQLKDQSLSASTSQHEVFLKGSELFASSTNVADEIASITSLSNVAETLREMTSQVTIYAIRPGIFGIGTKREELYKPFFKVQLIEGLPNVLNVPVTITFQKDSTYRIQASIDEGSFLSQTNAIGSTSDKILKDITIDQKLKLTETYNSANLNFRLNIQEITLLDTKREYTFVINEIRSLAESFQNNLSVEPIFEGANILNIKSSANLPEKGIDFVNTLMRNFINNSLSKKNRLARETIASIDKQLDLAVDTLFNIEGSLEDFRLKNEIIDIGKTSESLSEQLTALREKKSDLEVKIEYFEYLAGYIPNNESVDEMKSVSMAGVENPVLSNLLIELNDLIRERSSIAFSSSNESPVLKGVEERIRTTRAAVLGSVNNHLSAYKINLRNIDGRINKINTQISKLPRDERNLTSIERNFSLNDNLYSYLLQKRAEANIAVATNVADKTIVDEAHLVGQAFPNPTLLLLTIIIIGLLISFGFIIFKQLTYSKIVTEKDIPTGIEWPIIATISRDKYNLDELDSSKSFKIYQTLKSGNKGKGNVISITASRKDKGTYKFTNGLAEQLIALGERISLIYSPPSQDIKKSSKFSILRNFKKNSWQESLNPEILGLSEIHKLETKNFSQGGSIQKLIFKLRESNDFVLIITPPLNRPLAYYTIRKYLDYTFYIITKGSTTSSELAEQYDNLALRENIGIILTDEA